MNIIFESTKKFEKELNKFPKKQKEMIILKLNQYSHLLDSRPESFYKHVHQPIKLRLVNNNEPSLYSLRINPEIRIIMTVDDDPLFDQITITLLHVVRRSELNRVYKIIAESIYQGNLLSNNKENFDDGAN